MKRTQSPPVSTVHALPLLRLNARERKELVEGLVDDAMDTIREGDDGFAWAESLITNGFAGFAKMTDAELISEARGQDLLELVPPRYAKVAA